VHKRKRAEDTSPYCKNGLKKDKRKTIERRAKQDEKGQVGGGQGAGP